jgi:hypothetical protein
MRGTNKSLAFIMKTSRYRAEKNSNFFHPSKKKSFDFVVNHPSTANVTSSMLKKCLPMRCFLRIRKR